MVTERQDLSTNRPYPPPSNVIAVLHRLRSRNLPERVDTEYLRDVGISEGTIGRTLFALRFLNLLGDAGEPTKALQSIATSTDEEYKATLSGLIKEAYSDVFKVIDPAEDTQDRILNVFRRYTPASQRNRMVTFFLGICREADIPTLDVPKQRAMAAPKPRSEKVKPARRPATSTATSPRGVAPSGPAGVYAALEGLLKSLPPPGTPLSSDRRERWLKMAEATLGFVYPEEEESLSEGQEHDSDEEF